VSAKIHDDDDPFVACACIISHYFIFSLHTALDAPRVVDDRRRRVVARRIIRSPKSRTSHRSSLSDASARPSSPRARARTTLIARTMSLKSINPNAELMNADAALFMNINAAKGLQDVMKTNLGPKGTIKMLVDGAGGARVVVRVCSIARGRRGGTRRGVRRWDGG
tara:strand:- start:2296 stop:2793 length:498 start_codon:yes stop_codon:yes gene_type:complete